MNPHDEELPREVTALDDLEAPEPRPGLEARMWARVAPELAPAPRRIVPALGPLGWAALSATVLVVALAGFLAGRSSRPATGEIAAARTLSGLSPAARERVLRAALADHLEASQRLLLELANGASTLDDERASAASLLSANRLYRRAAERSGERRVAAVLAELDELLTELAEAETPSEQRLTQARASSEDLLFKVRIARNNLKGTS